ncbi:right-handed parallel beta-helix repeat-containing protein [bacterium]|nr:right-handed parallel beta-helix repeat-containing protein [bacterium]
MSTYSKIFVAVIVIVLTVGSPSVIYAEDVTNAIIYEYLLNEGDFLDTYPVPDGAVFTESILFPPENPGDPEDDLPTDTYTIEFDCVDVTFDEGFSLTIQTTPYGATTGTGRINAHGISVHMVTFDKSGANNWGGIIIQSDPDGGNLIEYCQIQNVTAGANEGAVYINGIFQCVVANCNISNVQGGAGLAASGGEYSFRSNEISGCNGGIICIGAMDDGEESAIINNILHTNFEPGVSVSNGWDGSIVNNIVYDNAQNQIELVNCPLSQVVNNTVDGGDNASGIVCTIAWTDDIRNNIIINCDPFGIVGIDAGSTYDYCLFDGNAIDNSNCVDGGHSIDDDPPDFVNEGNHDYHFEYTSSGVNDGDPAEAYYDPDDSDNDIGAFGGQPAGDFNIDGYEDYIAITEEGLLFDEDVCNLGLETYGMLGDNTVDDGEVLTIEPGVKVDILP